LDFNQNIRFHTSFTLYIIWLKKPLTKTLPNDIIQFYFILISVEQLFYKYENVMQQIDSSSCGFFTITCAIDIAFGIDPKKSKCILSQMQLYFWKKYKKHKIVLGIFLNASYIHQFHLFTQPLQI
jgi:hypothetical protein